MSHDAHDDTAPRASFTAMVDAKREDWLLIADQMKPFQRDLPNRILTHLKLLQGDYGGYSVDRFEHSLQSATLAHRAGRDEEYVVCALLHDIGDTLGSANHADVAAAILKPYVSEANHWMIEHHGIFQGYYFFDYLGLDRDMRDQYRGHPHFEPGIEAHGGFGEVGAIGSLGAHRHQMGPSAMGRFRLGAHRAIRYQAAWVFGLTSASPDSTARLQFEYEF